VAVTIVSMHHNWKDTAEISILRLHKVKGSSATFFQNNIPSLTANKFQQLTKWDGSETMVGIFVLPKTVPMPRAWCDPKTTLGFII